MVNTFSHAQTAETGIDTARQIINMSSVQPITMLQWQGWAQKYSLVKSGRGQRVIYTQAIIDDRLPVRMWRVVNCVFLRASCVHSIARNV